MLTGLAAGTLVAAFSKDRFWKKTCIVLTGAVGGVLPDIDAISMWSKFDRTFGAWFNLQHSGREIYSSKFWYSHHAFFHSIAASILLALLLGFLVYLIAKIRKSVPAFIPYVRANALFPLSFVMGYWAHLVFDMPTPASAWGGVNLWWPSPTYIGGSGQIWWWNNYDIFLLVAVAVSLNLLILLIAHFGKLKAPRFTLLIALMIGLLIVFQVNTRKVDYNSGNFSKLEAASKEEQQRILCKKLYKAMERLDSKVKVNF